MIDRIKNNKFLLALLCLITIGLILLIFRVTYAYLKEHLDASDRAKVDINLTDAYSLKFIPGSNLDLDVTAKTLPENGDDLTVTSNPSVQLFEPNLGTEHSYNVYLSIPTNPFVYTEEGTPEILLKVQNGEEEIKLNNNITYNEDLGGFDITNFRGTIPIIEDCKISSPELKEVTHNWTFTLTYRNLDIDQSINLDKTLNVKLIMQDEKITTEDILLAYANTSTQITLYHHNANDLTDLDMENNNLIANDDSYRYSGSNDVVNNYVCFGGDCSNDPNNPNYKYLYRIIGLFKNDAGQYEMKLIKADAATAEDLGEGTNPNSAYYGDYTNKINYKGKLSNFAAYAWNNTSGATEDANNVNMWKESNLNTKNLNETFYNVINQTYQSMIISHEWQVGGYIYTNEDVKTTYDYELGPNKLTTLSNICYNQGKADELRTCDQDKDIAYQDEIGLMYISDYMYATLPKFWNVTAENYCQDDILNNNWLFLGIDEWTISRNVHDAKIARIVNSAGSALQGGYIYNSALGVRPTFYLSSTVKITGGSGAETDPFKLAVN